MQKVISQQEFEKMMNHIPVNISEQQYQKFKTYGELLVQWNEKINLTAITEDREVAVKHFCDSILPLSLVDFPDGASVIDIGTGAGFPGIPFKIMRDDLNITLLDSLEKRLVFLRQVCEDINIECETVHARAEQYGKAEGREMFHVATSRAVANLALLAELSLPMVKVGGMVVALKGSTAKEEIEAGNRAIDLCGGKVEKVVDYNLPNGDPRSLVIIRKISTTPDKYPRNSAQISKKTL